MDRDYQQIAADQGLKIIRMSMALKALLGFGGLGNNYSATVRCTIVDWIERGMDGPIPWPGCPFFEDWAQKNGVENINGFMGYRMTANISDKCREGNSDDE